MIVFSDATLAGFSFSLSGHTLTFTGGSLALSNLPFGSIFASAAAGGGVQLALQSAITPVPHARDNDFNGDGHSDVLWRGDDGTLTDWLGGANGTFSGNWDNFNNNPGTSWHVVGTGDFNGDGSTDLLLRNDTGTVNEWLGQSNGGFVANPNGSNGVPTSWHVVGIGDYNGDSIDDVLWQNSDGTLTDWLGGANGAFTGNWDNFHNNPGTTWHIQDPFVHDPFA
jgi:hypothetical protein